MELKWCPDCSYAKPLDEFYVNRSSPDGRTRYCKPCIKVRCAETRDRQTRGQQIAPDQRRRRRLPPRTEKRCPRCGETKSLAEFGKNRSNTSGLAAYCRPCHNVVSAETNTRLYGKRGYRLRTRYGITAADFDKMVAVYEGMCWICRERPAEHVDHDHETGEVRGVLCFTCNVGLGNFRDRPELLDRAHTYLTDEFYEAFA